MKLNISLSEEVVALLRDRAQQTADTVSGYISRLVLEDWRKQQEALADEGYKWLSGLNDGFAEEGIATASQDWAAREAPADA